MKQLIFATNNQHKLNEVKAVLGNDIEILGLKDIGCFDEIPETENSLEGNALLKARYVFDKYAFDCFADDTGLEVEALDGRPGVFSARYAGETQDAAKNIHKLLTEMYGIDNRNAQFRTVIALIENGKVRYFEGKITGQITSEPYGNSGFGYDPVFVPDGFSQTFATLGGDLKNKISHRALAINELTKYFESHLR